MARGGFVKPEVAVVRLFAVLGSRDAARTMLVDALKSGQLSARGKKVLDWPREQAKFPNLRNLAEPGVTAKPNLAGLADVPAAYWAEITDADFDEESVRSGAVICRAEIQDANHFGYHSVVFKESELNILATRFAPATQTHQGGTVERRRQATWDDWVAAVAILAYEHAIDQDTDHQSIMDLANSRMTRWGLEPKQSKTVIKAAMAVADRFRRNPPATPLVT